MFFVAKLLLTLSANLVEPLPQTSLEEKKEKLFAEITDRSDLPFLSPEIADRKIAKLRLPNGFEALLISDPKTTLSAAAVVVSAGSWNDPEQYPGMAHFCEHMLFMGTAKYPDENEFMNKVADHGGMTNAMTAPDRTLYLFSSNEEGFLPLLDRFSHFFIDPLFKPDNIAKELHAVDQEFYKNIEHDGFRTLMVLKETGNQDHPNHLFSCGNSQTLSKIPQKDLIEWNRRHYSADKMALVIYSSLDLDLLKEKTALLFSQVPVFFSSKEKTKSLLTSKEQQGKITYIQPVMEKRELTLLFELPPSLCNDPSHSADLIAYALKRGQKKGLYELLQKEELIERLSVHVEEIGGNDHKFFEVSFELTEKGMKKPELVVQYFFENLLLFKRTGIPHYLFEEMNQTAKLQYQYQSRKEPFHYVQETAYHLVDEPLDTYPKNLLLANSYSQEKIKEVLDWLTFDKALFLFLAPTDRPLEKKEKWSGVSYDLFSLPGNWIASWEEAHLNSEIRIAEPNPYLPTQMSIASREDDTTYPSLLAEHDLGKAYYFRAESFQSPEGALFLHILSPKLQPTAKSEVLADLYVDYLTDELRPTLMAAKQAGLKANLDVSHCRLNIELLGFSQKAPLLLETILSQLKTTSPSKEKFQAMTESLQKRLKNEQRQLAFRQAKTMAAHLILPEQKLPKEKEEALLSIQYEDFLAFQNELFEETYVEGFFGGNLTLKEAQKSWLDVIHLLGKKAFPKEEHPQSKSVAIPVGPYIISETTEVQGNSTFLVIDQGSFSFEKRASQEIVASALKEAFFNELRTKQKTGYIALSDAREIEGRLYHFFTVQSSSYLPQELLYRFELFLEQFLDDLPQKISEERFFLLQKGVISAMQGRVSNFKDKMALLDLLAFQYNSDFQFLEKRIDAIQKLSYEEFLKDTKQFFSRENKKRLAVFYEGKNGDPFSYEIISPNSLLEIALQEER